VIGRILAGIAAVLALAAAVAITTAAAHLPLSSYVSEAGASGSPYGDLYRAGILTVAAVAGLLAAVFGRRAASVALPLALAVPAIAVSGSVRCTPGCPLPPYEPTTTADVVHAVGSIAGVGLCALAMLALAYTGRGTLRRISRCAVAVGWPLLAATAVGLAAVGRSLFTGTAERLALLVCLGWLVAVASSLFSDRREPPTQQGPVDAQGIGDRREP
jgi:hypothetical protein